MEILAVDTGNKQIKTKDLTFNAGLVSHGKTAPAIRGDVIVYNGEYYSLSNNRAPNMRDKTVNNTYFILTLFAIAKQLCFEEKASSGVTHIVLAMGLPPTHLPALKEKYQKYFSFNNKSINFIYNSVPFSIVVDAVNVYPQGFAATVPYTKKIKEFPKSFIIDIGGYTTDVIMLVNGMVDVSYCESFDMGVIHLYNRILRKINNELGISLNDDIQIEAVLRGNAEKVNEQVCEIIYNEAKAYGVEIIRKLEEKGVEITISLPIFIGGGSALLRKYLKRACSNKEPMFISNVNANAIGYHKLAVIELNRG